MNSRTFVSKALLSADEYLAFRNRCKQVDIPQSRQQRNLINQWTNEGNLTPTRRRMERPRLALNMAMFPSRNMRL